MVKRVVITCLFVITFAVAFSLLQDAPPSYAQFPPGTVTATPLPPNFTPTITLTPTPPLTPLPTSIAPGCATTLPISIGATVTVRPGVNIRYGPSPSSPWLANFQEPRDFLILDGPVCDSNFIWWQIQGQGIIGWVAERSTTLNFISYIDSSTVPGANCNPALDLSTGDEIELITGVRIRQTAGIQGLTLTVAPFGAMLTVLSDSAECVDGYNWRLVEVEVVNVVYRGYMAEGSNSTGEDYYIAQDVPTSICSPPMDLSIGETGRIRAVDNVAKNLRAEPSLRGTILYSLVDGVPFEVIGGPVCVDNQVWWQIRIRSNISASGWVAQGPRPNYWLDPDYVGSPYGIPHFP